MPHEIGYVDDSSMYANRAMLQKIRDLASANGWTVLLYDVSGDTHYLVLQGAGNSGTEQIYVGFSSYQTEGTDIYNLSVAAFTGYVEGNVWAAQPGYVESFVPAHGRRIDYWLTVNAQRIAFALLVGGSICESAYVGKFLPYATPSQYPYPVICAGMTASASARFSSTNPTMPYKGNASNLRLRFNDGTWKQPLCYPWTNGYLTGGQYQRDVNGQIVVGLGKCPRAKTGKSFAL